MTGINRSRRGASLVAMIAIGLVLSALGFAISKSVKTSLSLRTRNIQHQHVKNALATLRGITANSNFCTANVITAGQFTSLVAGGTVPIREVDLGRTPASSGTPYIKTSMPMDSNAWVVTGIRADLTATPPPQSVRFSSIKHTVASAEMVVQYQYPAGSTTEEFRVPMVFIIKDSDRTVAACLNDRAFLYKVISFCNSLGGRVSYDDPLDLTDNAYNPSAPHKPPPCILGGGDLIGLQFAGSFQTGPNGLDDGFNSHCEGAHKFTGKCRCPKNFIAYPLGRVCEQEPALWAPPTSVATISPSNWGGAGWKWNGPDPIRCEDASAHDYDEPFGCYRDFTVEGL